MIQKFHVQIRLVKVYFNILSVQILRNSIFINRRRFLNATFRIETIFGSKNVVCLKKKAHTSFIMKVTSFYSLEMSIFYPKTILYPLTLTRFLMFNTTYVLRNTIVQFFSSISLLQPILEYKYGICDVPNMF